MSPALPREALGLAGARGWRRASLPVARIEALLAAHDDALEADDERVAKRGPRSRVTVHGDVAVRERLAPGLAAVRDVLLPRRRRAAAEGALALEARGVPAARALAHVERHGRVWDLFEDLSALPRLDHHVHGTWRAGSKAARAALCDATARWLAGLHREGIYHGDLKAVNVRVRDGDGPRPVLVLLDTDRVVLRRRPVGDRRRRKNLVQLAGSIGRVVTSTDRLRFWRHYVEALGRPVCLAAEARAVTAGLARRRVVVDDPLE